MKTIRIDLPSRNYPVYLGRGLLPRSELWKKHLGDGKILIVSNETVAPLYLDTLMEALAGKNADVHVIPDGERFKTFETWRGILDRLVAIEARRDATLIALGGGVVGDVTGFAAASYMRGIRFLQSPTTLLAQVDASVGGKTGINHERGKNLVGAFHQPAAVIIDSATLDTLEKREFNAGLAEVVKYGAIFDAPFFGWLEENAAAVIARDPTAIDFLIERSVETKADIVREDEKEAGIRALLNFGHSFGHALESETAYSKYLHGEAVAIGMVTAARLSENRGLCPAGTEERLSSLLRQFDLPVNIPADVSPGRLQSALSLDKKAVAGGLRLVLLEETGRAIVDRTSSPAEIAAAIEQGLA
jgi:3-dehydroquinate synthase